MAEAVYSQAETQEADHYEKVREACEKLASGDYAGPPITQKIRIPGHYL